MAAPARGGQAAGAIRWSAPKESINPVAVEAMAEAGMDITGNIPQKLEYETAQGSDVIVTMDVVTRAVLPGKAL